MASAPQTLTETTSALCLLLILLVPFAAAGLALINSGLGRSRSAAHMMFSSLCVFGVAALVYFAIGFAWQGYPGRASHSIAIGGKSWDWIGADRFLWRSLVLDGSPASLAALLGMMSVGVAAVIPLGSGADRWRLGAACASTAILSGWTYPLFAHWIWGGGWLAQLGVNYEMGGGFVDTGGSATIQGVGGVSALAISWILKPRRSKYAPNRMPMAIPGHNTVIVLLGCFLAWVGWIGLDCAGAILYTGAAVSKMALIVANATLAAASAMLASAYVTRLRFGKADASLSANGWVAGLVASSAGCAVIPPVAAILIGIVAGVMVTFAVGWLEMYLTLDDPGGSISVHLIGGIWGIFAAGWFAQSTADANLSGTWLAQLTGVATLLGCVLPMTYALNWILNHFYPIRVTPAGEHQGLDLHELGSGAYPDFMTHRDD